MVMVKRLVMGVNRLVGLERTKPPEPIHRWARPVMRRSTCAVIDPGIGSKS